MEGLFQLVQDVQSYSDNPFRDHTRTKQHLYNNDEWWLVGLLAAPPQRPNPAPNWTVSDVIRTINNDGAMHPPQHVLPPDNKSSPTHDAFNLSLILLITWPHLHLSLSDTMYKRNTLTPPVTKSPTASNLMAAQTNQLHHAKTYFFSTNPPIPHLCSQQRRHCIELYWSWLPSVDCR
jgi:hypothetical protein